MTPECDRIRIAPIVIVTAWMIATAASAPAQHSSPETDAGGENSVDYESAVERYLRETPETTREAGKEGTGGPYKVLREQIVVYSRSSRSAIESGAGRWETEAIDPAVASTALTASASPTQETEDERNYALFNLLIGLASVAVGALVTVLLLHVLGEVERQL